jgi:hypothetical protein
MIELVFVACLSTATDRCEEQSLLFQDMPMQVCTMRAQIALADWVGHHPDWKIEEWHCVVPDTRAESV